MRRVLIAGTDYYGNPGSDYIYLGGKLVADVNVDGTLELYAPDALGSNRVTVSPNFPSLPPGILTYDADFTPFGVEYQIVGNYNHLFRFEGEPQDLTTNDHFDARTYSSRFGRWLSADWSSVPVAVPYANLSNPQTLNLYAMVADDPESFADLDGHDPPPPGSPAGQQNTSCLNGANQGPCQAPSTAEQTQEASAAPLVAPLVIKAGEAGVAGLPESLPFLVIGGLALIQSQVGGGTGLELDFSQAVFLQEDNASKDTSSGPKADEAQGKSTTPTGKSSSGQDINAYGEKLGPSRKPVRHGTDFSTRKRAKDAARQAGDRNPDQDKGHFHPVDRDGERFPNAGHYKFPE